MKIIDIIKTANANLLKAKLRTFLTILAIFVGSFAIITTTAIQTGVNSFIDEQVSAAGGEGFIEIIGASVDSTMELNMGGTGSPQEYSESGAADLKPITAEQIEQVKNISGINADSLMTTMSVQPTYVQSTKNDKKFTANTNIFPAGSMKLELLAGTLPETSDSPAVAIPSDWVSALGYKEDADAIGETLIFALKDEITSTITEFTAEISGVLAPSVITSNALIVNQPLNDQLYAETTKYYPESEKTKTYILAATFDYQNYDAAKIKEQVEELGLTAFTVEDIVGEIKTFFDVIITVFRIFGYIALIAAAIGIINTLFMSVQERTREIGLMKAMGLSNFKVFLSFTFEAIALGFWGSIFGVIVSMAIGYSVDALAHQGDAFLTAFPTFHLVEYTFVTILPVILLVMFIAFLAGTAPALRAAKKDPIEALRYE